MHYCLSIGQFVKNLIMWNSVQFSYVALYAPLDGAYCHATVVLQSHMYTALQSAVRRPTECTMTTSWHVYSHVVQQTSASERLPCSRPLDAVIISLTPGGWLDCAWLFALIPRLTEIPVAPRNCSHDCQSQRRLRWLNELSGLVVFFDRSSLLCFSLLSFCSTWLDWSVLLFQDFYRTSVL